MAHYELFKMALELPGVMIECGVFKGASLSRLTAFRALFGGSQSRKIVAFDTFGFFPEANFPDDTNARQQFVNAAGSQSVSAQELTELLKRKGAAEQIELVAGNILETVPTYLNNNPQLKISLLNLDTDLFEPAVVILENFWQRLVPGGILILDDYGVFPGETKAVDDFFKDKPVQIQKLPFSLTPCFIRKT